MRQSDVVKYSTAYRIARRTVKCNGIAILYRPDHGDNLGQRVAEVRAEVGPSSSGMTTGADSPIGAAVYSDAPTSTRA